ncbi:MAG: orotidine-5'-phosphate decarboxylase [bacterium]
MANRNFRDLLESQWSKGNFVCVGLDTEFDSIPERVRYASPQNAMCTFNREIVDATKDLVCAYKPNTAFYEAHGSEGISILRETIEYIHQVAPDVPVILDAKRADIGNTNKGYARFAFDLLGADAITVHPYLGAEAMKPFLDRKEKGVIVLCRTSNPGAGEFQDLRIDGEPLCRVYRVVAHNVATKWNANGNCAVVVGATYPEELGEVRAIVGDMPILIPGIGAQGGDVEKTVRAGQDSRGQGMIINSSRGIIFASKLGDFDEAARRETIKLRDSINQYRK